jgi:hypothetical protein
MPEAQVESSQVVSKLVQKQTSSSHSPFRSPPLTVPCRRLDLLRVLTGFLSLDDVQNLDK